MSYRNVYNEQMEKQALVAQGMAGCLDLKPPSLKDQMTDKLTRLESQAQETKELLTLLERNPDFEKMLSLLGRGGLY